MVDGKEIDGHWYYLEQSGLTRIEAINIAAACKRNQRAWNQGRGGNRRYWARAIRYHGAYAVFIRHSGF